MRKVFVPVFIMVVMVSFSLSSCGGSKKKGKGGNVSGVTELSEVENLAVTPLPEGGKLKLTWKMPDDSRVKGVVIVRKVNSEPSDLSDGEQVYSGSATEFTDTGLTNGVKYFYRVATTDGKGNFSEGVVVSGVPLDTVPPPDVSNVQVITAPEGSALLLIWQNPADPEFQGVKIVRKTGSAPTSVSDGTVVYTGNSEEFKDTGLVNGTLYYYRIFSYDDDGNYSDGVIVAGTPQDLPPPPVGEFRVTVDPAGNTLLLSWSNPDVPDFNGIKILRKENTVPDSCNDSDADEVYNSNATDVSSYTDSFLTDDQLYCYGVCSIDAAGQFSSMVTACAIPHDSLPPSQVYAIGVTVVPEGNILELYWSEPSDDDYMGVLVLRGRDGYCPTATNDTYPGVVTVGVFNTGTAYFKDTGLENDVDYCYSFFSFDEVPNYSAPAQFHATPHDSVPPEGPDDAKSAPTFFGNIVAWHMSTTDDVSGYLVLARSDRYPTGATDPEARVVYRGYLESDSSSFYSVNDTGASLDTLWYYSIYSYDETPNYSTPAYAKSGLFLHAVDSVGVSGLISKMVPYRSGYAIFYTDSKTREGLKVAYNPDDFNFAGSSFATVTTQPVSSFDVTDDGSGGYYVSLFSLWDKAGLNLYHFDGNVTYVRRITTIADIDSNSRFSVYFATSLYREGDNLHFFYFEVTHEVTLTEAVYNTVSGTLSYKREITTAPADYIPLKIVARYNPVSNRGEVVCYYFSFSIPAAQIVYGREDNGNWSFFTVDQNSGYTLSPPAFEISDSGKGYIFYRRNEADYTFRGVLKIYPEDSTIPTVQTFGKEYSINKALLLNSPAIVLDGDRWEVVRYVNESGIIFTEGELTGLYMDGANPVTVTIENYPDFLNRAFDYPLLGVKSTSAFISSGGKLFISAWNQDLKSYEGVPFSSDPFSASVIEENQDYHLPLLPVIRNGGFDLFEDETGNVNVMASGFKRGGAGVYGLQISASVAKIGSSASGFNIFDSDYISTSNGKRFFISVGVSDGSDLVFYSRREDESNYSSKTIASSVNPAFASLAYVPSIGSGTSDRVIVAYIDNSRNVSLCQSDYTVGSGWGDFTCNSLSLGATPSAILLDIEGFWNGSDFTADLVYTALGRIRLAEIVNGTVSDDSPLSIPGGTKPYILRYGDPSDPGIAVVGYSTSTGDFFVRSIRSDSFSSSLPDGRMLPCDDSPSYAPGNRDMPPQLLYVFNGTTYDRSVFYIKDNTLYMGVEVPELGCWFYNIPLALFVNGDQDYLRADSVYGTGVDHYVAGFAPQILFRNSGTPFYLDIYLTR